METNTQKNILTREKVTADWEQIEKELADLEVLQRQTAILQRKEKQDKLRHPIRWYKKHKNDPGWMKYKNIGIKFVSD